MLHAKVSPSTQHLAPSPGVLVNVHGHPEWPWAGPGWGEGFPARRTSVGRDKRAGERVTYLDRFLKSRWAGQWDL